MGFTLNYIYIDMHFLKALPLSWHFHNSRSHTLAPAPALRISDLGLHAGCPMAPLSIYTQLMKASFFVDILM